MRAWIVGVLFSLCVAALPAAAQDTTSLVDFSGGYTYVRANAPPTLCGCFAMNGGNVSANINASKLVGIAGDLDITHNGNVNGSGIGLTLYTFTFGPRYSFRNKSRFTPFAETLVGGSFGLASGGHGLSFAMNLGGGLDYRASEHWSVRMVEADYFYSHFANGVNGHQDNLRIGVGVVYHFGQR
jgi:outer membrane immunogenic protein